MIETLDNRFGDRDYVVELSAPEFTSVCPMTGAPDFGELTIRYVPDEKLFELTRVVASAGDGPESWISD